MDKKTTNYFIENKKDIDLILYCIDPNRPDFLTLNLYFENVPFIYIISKGDAITKNEIDIIKEKIFQCQSKDFIIIKNRIRIICPGCNKASVIYDGNSLTCQYKCFHNYPISRFNENEQKTILSHFKPTTICPECLEITDIDYNKKEWTCSHQNSGKPVTCKKFWESYGHDRLLELIQKKTSKLYSWKHYLPFKIERYITLSVIEMIRLWNEKEKDPESFIGLFIEKMIYLWVDKTDTEKLKKIIQELSKVKKRHHFLNIFHYESKKL